MRSLKTSWKIVVFTTIVAVMAWSFYTPVPYSIFKLADIIGFFVLTGAFAIYSKSGRYLAALIALMLFALSLVPARPGNTQSLREQYARSLIAYRETPYVWGGENGRGIDCSGLIRRALIDALISEGWRRHDPGAWREAAFIWWHDCSASEMKNGYRGRIDTISGSRSLNRLSPENLQIGDLAVMKSGVHVLAYLGGGTWIQADPNLANGGGKVIETTVPSRSGWFGQGVLICRWQCLDSGHGFTNPAEL